MIFYGPKEAPRVKELGQKSPGLPTRVEGVPTPLERALVPRGLLVGPPDLFLTPTSPINAQTSRK